MSSDLEPQANTTPDIAARRKRARRFVGIIATAAIAVGGGATVAKQIGAGEDHQINHSRFTPNTPPSKTPTIPTTSPSEKPTANVVKTIEQLSGYGRQVAEQQRQMLRASSVEIIISQKDLDDPYSAVNYCTGVKVNVGGQNYVATARHCFINAEEATDQYPHNSSPDRAHDPTLTQPRDITEGVKNLRKDVNVYPVNADGDPDMDKGVTATSITASFYPDMALLKVDDSGTGAAKFDALPSIAYESLLGGDAEPGAQAVIYSTPLSAGPRMIETRGRYLGITSDPDDEANSLAWVAIDGADVAKDGCYKDGSGSAAYIAGAGLTGPLHSRNHPGDENPIGEKGTNRAQILAQLNVDLGANDTTLCGFSIVTPDFAANMAQVASTS